MAGVALKLGNGRRKLLTVMWVLAALVIFHQFWVFPSERYSFDSSSVKKTSSFLVNSSSRKPGSLILNRSFGLVNDNANVGDEGKESGGSVVSGHGESGNVFSKDVLAIRKFRTLDDGVKDVFVEDFKSSVDSSYETVYSKIVEDARDLSVSMNSKSEPTQIVIEKTEPMGAELNSSSATSRFMPLIENKPVAKLGSGSKGKGLELSWKNESLSIERYVRRMRGATVTLSEMKSLLLNGHASSTSVNRRWSSPRDRELHSASLQIRNAPVLRSSPDFHAPLFRNASVFVRGYDLMVRLLKIYVYKEGEKPIFHQPKVRGIYAAEGWFMKLIERSKHFVVRDPKKAHMFYLPFSADILRNTLNSHSMKNLEHYLSDYVDLIKKKHRFWNRTAGADHFFVACHDWGPRITRPSMDNCIRALCNANVARGFSIGKDVSVPVTYVRSGNEPTRDIGGKPSSERNVLAFFAGQMHGYVRPLLLQYWENKTLDMKIIGPMQRNVEGKAVYREYMKSSKYCICARGYGVHTPRVVESIFYECVPVIISDNYVPPFFEVLDWEAFAVFVLEKDIPNLRNILLSIPEDKYRDMQLRVKMVQRHFIWHKTPEKYDLFHMILHSIWYSRVSQMRPL